LIFDMPANLMKLVERVTTVMFESLILYSKRTNPYEVVLLFSGGTKTSGPSFGSVSTYTD